MSEYFYETSGEIELSGDADMVLTKSFYLEASGEIELSGDADALKIGLINIETSGSLLASGEASLESYITTFGGICAGGTSDASVEVTKDASGGLRLAGEASVESYIPTFGGIFAGGTSDASVEVTKDASGGLRLAGEATRILFYFPEITGGVNSTGTVFVRIIFLPSGSILCSGESIVEISFITLGGIEAGVKSDTWYYIYEPRLDSAASGVRAFGNGNDVGKRVFFDQASGSLLIQGSSSTALTSATVTASGAISLSGGNSYNFVFKKKTRFLYNLNGKITRTLQFNWNLGQLTMYWYRVVGKGGTDPCLPQEPCCQKIIMNVHARSLSELCEKLSSRRFKFPIESVQRFRRAMDNAVVNEQEQNGINQDCNDLIPVEVCEIPACANFCIDQDISEIFGFSFIVQVDAFKEFSASGPVFISGSANSYSGKNLPKFEYQSSGDVSFTGSAICFSSIFYARGGASCSGSAKFKHSRWRYSGGIWPNTTNVRYPSIVSSQASSSIEQVWSLSNRVFKDDSLYTSTDLSYAKTSQTLFVKGFNLSFPDEDITILRLVVYIDRVATQVGIRDKEIYLVNGTTKISDNLAVTGTDWPFLQTVRSYGANGWRNPNDDYYLGPISKEELSDPEFGIALKVNSINSSTFALARINYIAIEALYESSNGSLIRVSSGSGVRTKSSSIHGSATGKILLQSISDFGPKKRFVQRVRSAGLRVGGVGHIQYFETASGGSKIGGEARITPFIEESVGGLAALGEAEVKPFWDVMLGGVKGSGKWSGSGSWHYITSGEITISGNALTPEKKYYYVANSGVSLYGGARIRKNNWKWTSDGNAIFAFGSSDSTGGTITLTAEQLTFSMSILQSNISFLSDVDKQDAVGTTDVLNKCGCFNVPSAINVTHNLATDNLLAKFLIRNNLTIARTLELRYNVVNNSWQSNLHYKALAVDSNNYESWDIVCEVQCTSVVGSIILGNNIWKTAFQISRMNLTTREKNETRIMLAVLPENICSTAVSQLNFQIKHNTKTGIAYSNPSSVTIYQSNVYDNIGLFRSRAWYENPDLTIRVAQSTLQKTQRKVTFSIVR